MRTHLQDASMCTVTATVTATVTPQRFHVILPSCSMLRKLRQLTELLYTPQTAPLIAILELA